MVKSLLWWLWGTFLVVGLGMRKAARGVWGLSVACIVGEWSWGFREGIRVFEEACGVLIRFVFNF